jgi:acyl carrier protein
MDDIRAKFQAVLRDVFDDDTLVVHDSTTAAEVEGWDSLMHINLIIAIEKRFGVKFATAEISRLKEPGQNIGTFLRLLISKLPRTA